MHWLIHWLIHVRSKFIVLFYFSAYRVINRLPQENQLFLQYLMPLLYRISRYSKINGMNSINLAICFAPSLLWPDSGLDVIKNEVPPLVQFMVEHSPKIFGEELPVLYKRLGLPASPGAAQMELDKSPSKQLVPTKIEDGEKYNHERSESLDSWMSEGSAGEDMEESNLLRNRDRGLTYSDSQLSQISQFDDYDVHAQPPRSREEFVGRRVAHKHPRSGFAIGSGLPHRPDFEKPEPKRVKKIQSRKPERSSSLHGTMDSPESVSARMRQRKSRERMEYNAVRRKSIATQTTLPRKTEQFVNQLAPIPQSSSSSLTTSSSQSAYGSSPRIVNRTTTLGERSPSAQQHQAAKYRSYTVHEDSRHMMESVSMNIKKKRRLPQYSHSFSNQSENKPNKPIHTSNSFYDRLLPLDAPGQGSRGHFAGDEEQPKPTWHIGADVSQGQGTRQLGMPLTSSLVSHSNQSVSSSRSGSSTGIQGMHYLSRPSNVSLASSHSSGSGGRASPASTEGSFRKPDRGQVKDMITARFNIQHHNYPSPSSSSSSNAQSKQMTRRLGTSYQHEPMQVQQHQKEQTGYDGEDSLERVRQKMIERKRLDDTMSSDPSFMKSPSYQSFVSSHQKKDSSLKSLTEEVGNIDDRPESDQHLHSLPRPHTAEFVRQQKPSAHPLLHQAPQIGQQQHGYVHDRLPLAVGAVLETVHDHDTNKLTVSSSGYNSDTESSPSRTLNRAGKLNEVTTPVKTTMPNRYRGPLQYSGGGGGGRDQQQSHQPKSRQQHYQDLYLQSKTVGKSGNSPTPSSSSSGQPQMQTGQMSSQAPMQVEGGVGRRTLSASGRSSEEAVGSLVSDFNASSKASLANRRPKSGDGTKKAQTSSERLSKQHSPLERTNSNIEDVKIKLGLIPSPRQRSKSTSDKEAMKVIHKVIEEEEASMRSSQQEEKHKEWLSSAPTSAERRKAWENFSKQQQQQFQRAEGRTRSFRNDGVAAIEKPPLIKPSITPELKRKSATMPDYLVTGSSRYPALRGSNVRTVKVTSYEVPEAKKVRKINLRTYH